MSSTALPPVPDRIGRYRIERKIGEGGMGVVYAARDERLDRTVALKTIRGDRDDTARRRLWREARAAAGISHPNICQLYEVEETDDGVVLAMELLAGEPLGARLARGPMTPAESSTIALQVLDALDALHSGGLIHRDLKPSNLFLTPHGVKLLDFGLARPIARSLGADTGTLLTEAGAIVGTPNYMSPEQVRGEALDGRADLFSLAVIFFEMLSGRMAFGGATMIDVLHAVLHEQPPALSGGATVAGLDRVIHKALQKQPADRYDAVTAMAAATRRPGQVVGMHFFNPVPLMKLVEVVRTILTDEASARTATEFVRSVGKVPVQAKDATAFIVNRLLVPYLLDAIRAYEGGLATLEDIDQAMKLGCGYPMGPFTLLDLVGLDTTMYVAEVMFDEFREPRYAPPPLLKRMVMAGQLGRKTGKGFYTYDAR